MDRERDIEAWLRRRIEDMGGLFLKFTSPGNAGVPDRLVVLKRGVVFVELKAENGVLTSLQSYQIARLKKLRQHAVVVFGMDGAKEFLADLKELARGSDRLEELAVVYSTKDFTSIGCLMDVMEDDGK